jgi:hypothetical protein
MERELQRGHYLPANSRAETIPVRLVRAKQLKNLLHIDIYYISAVGFN